jgi:predicted transposase YbfD/YdcC
MTIAVDLTDPDVLGPKSRLGALLEHLGAIEDPREAWRVAHPLPEILLLVVCGTIADNDDYEGIAAWGEAHVDFLRRFLPYHHGVPGARWLTQLMNRINPQLFSAAFSAWVRASWPDRVDLIAIDGKTSRRSHDRKADRGPLHLVSAFATTSRLVLGQEAVGDKSGETSAIPVLLERLAAQDGLKGALVSIDAIATNPAIATAICDAEADYLLAVKANQPSLQTEIESYFADAPAEALETRVETDKGHGRIEQRTVTVSRDVDWLAGDRRFPGELRLPGVTTLVQVKARTELNDRCRVETRYYISSAALDAKRAGDAVRGHWAIENSLHWVLDVVFADDQARVRKGHGARNMAVVRHFAINLVRSTALKKSIKLRRKIAAWNTAFLANILAMPAR